MDKEVTEERLKKYFAITQRALEKVKLGKRDEPEVYKDFLDMASRYASDAKYFFEQGRWVDAFAAVNYAHAWLDAGARLGVFATGGDTVLFAAEE